MATPSDPRGGPPQVRPPAQPRKPASSVLQQRAFAALILATISLLGLPGVGGNIRRGAVVLAVTMIIGAVGLWLSFTAMSRSRKAKTARPRFAVVASVLGIAGTGLSTLVLIGFAAFWPQISQYANCMSGANTVASQNACHQQLSSSLQTSMQLLRR